MTQRERWQREQRRYLRLAMRAALALPKRTIARSGVPAEQLSVPFNPADRAETSAAIRHLALAVRKTTWRRYFRLEMPNGMEHAIQVTAKGRSVRLLRYWDVRGWMATRLDVAGA